MMTIMYKLYKNNNKLISPIIHICSTQIKVNIKKHKAINSKMNIPRKKVFK